MKRVPIPLVAIVCTIGVLLLLVQFGCAAIAPARSIDASTTGPLILDVCQQHDDSVARDPLLVPAEKAQALRSTALLRAIVAAAMGPQPVPVPAPAPQPVPVPAPGGGDGG